LLTSQKEKSLKADGTRGKKKQKQNSKRADDCEIETGSLMNGPLSI